jgi:hypothetical protein
VGMTTCPRSDSYIEESVASLMRNGWGMPLIFNDHKMKGDFYGFLRLTATLEHAYPDAKQFLVLQDDIVCRETKDEAEKLIPSVGFGVLSLFNLNEELEFDASGDGWKSAKIDTDIERVRNCSGGIAYLVSKWRVRLIASWAKEHEVKMTPTPRRLGEFCHGDGFTYAVANERIFEHIGEKSSLHPDKPQYRWDVSAAEKYREKS